MLKSLLAATLTAAAVVSVAPTAQAAQPSCANPDAPLTVEEQRLTRAVPQQILKLSRFDRFDRVFSVALCSAWSEQTARVLVSSYGKQLWRHAVDTAQGGRAGSELPALDDRPLYWARLELSRSLRRWAPDFALSDAARERLIAQLNRSSRGHDAVAYPSGTRRVLISGFDPFILDVDIRRSNPSGSTALALDGTVIDTPSGPARVEATMFPVLWQPFAEGVVEDVFLPALTDERRGVDLFTTISQGRPERFDVEIHNGRWRGGFPDNDNVSDVGVIPVPPDVPTVTPAPEFVPSTLPAADMAGPDTGRFPVHVNASVTEIPAGETQPVFRPDGPTPGSTARAGSGGNYLSNEIAYRATLLRDAVHSDVPGGHLHTPVLQFGQGNTTEITDPDFEKNRSDIVDQIRAILTLAAATLDNSTSASD